MANIILSISTTHDKDVVRRTLSFNGNRNLKDFLDGLGGAVDEAASCTVQVKKADGVQATGTITVDDNSLLIEDDVVTVAGIALTAKTAGATGAQFNIGADADETAENLAETINASCSAYVSASATDEVVTVTAVVEGVVGNFIPLAVTLDDAGSASVSAATLADGEDDTSTAVSYLSI